MAAPVTFTDFLNSDSGKGFIGVGLSIVALYMLYKSMQKQQQLETRIVNLEYKTYTQDIIVKQLEAALNNRTQGGVQATFTTPVSGVPFQGVQSTIQMPGAATPPGVGTAYAMNRPKY